MTIKNLVLLASSLAFAPMAQAATIICNTSLVNGVSYSADIKTQQGAFSGAATLSSSHGMSQMIELLGSFPVSIKPAGMEGAEFINQEKGFELIINYQLSHMAPNNVVVYAGNLTTEVEGRRISEATSCVISNQ